MLTRALPRALLRASTSTSTAAVARSSTSFARAATATRTLSTTRPVRAAASHQDDHGHGHESHYDAPGGWLWGVRPGEKRQREGWEVGMAIYCASIVIAVVAYTMKEDTS